MSRNPLPVSARRLHRRRVRADGEVLERASLFPYFDSDGRVGSLMLVWPAEAVIAMLAWEADLVEVPWIGAVSLRSSVAELADAGAERAADLGGGLWHYDPWWVLAEKRFAGHPAVPVLKATNCVDSFEKTVHAAYFNRDLSRLEGFAAGKHKSSGWPEESRLEEIGPGILPHPPPRVRRPVAATAPGWRLDPFWLRQDWQWRGKAWTRPLASDP